MKNSVKTDRTFLCPCHSQRDYQHCCEPYHKQLILPSTAEQLMRSRYTAYALKNLDYIVQTTIPNQQSQLDLTAIQNWMESVEWLGLEIINSKVRSKIHENVAFNAYFQQNGEKQIHYENSLFVKIQERWYFVDHSLPLPTMKSPCLCGSNKKFKHCCGAFLTE